MPLRQSQGWQHSQIALRSCELVPVSLAPTLRGLDGIVRLGSQILRAKNQRRMAGPKR